MQTLQAKMPAPNFTLLDQNEQAVNLSDFLGRKVLCYFYPKAMTPGCTTQAKELRDHLSQFSAHQVTVIGISTDPTTRLAKFTARDQLNFILLSDPEHKVAELFGVWGEKKFMGRTYDGLHRISFLIDEAGQIEQVFTRFKTKDHHQVILDYLAQASA